MDIPEREHKQQVATELSSELSERERLVLGMVRNSIETGSLANVRCFIKQGGHPDLPCTRRKHQSALAVFKSAFLRVYDDSGIFEYVVKYIYPYMLAEDIATIKKNYQQLLYHSAHYHLSQSSLEKIRFWFEGDGKHFLNFYTREDDSAAVFLGVVYNRKDKDAEIRKYAADKLVTHIREEDKLLLFKVALLHDQYRNYEVAQFWIDQGIKLDNANRAFLYDELLSNPKKYKKELNLLFDRGLFSVDINDIRKVIKAEGFSVKAHFLLEKSGSSLLTAAFKEGDIENVSFLLDNGMDVAKIDASFVAGLLDKAAADNQPPGSDYPAIIRLLIDRLHFPINAEKDGVPFWLTASSKTQDFVKTVGATLDGLDIHRGTSFLSRAVAKGDLATVRLLLEHGANPNIADANSGDTPLLIALKKNNEAIAELLLDAGAATTCLNKKGISPVAYSRFYPNTLSDAVVKRITDAAESIKNQEHMALLFDTAVTVHNTKLLQALLADRRSFGITDELLSNAVGRLGIGRKDDLVRSLIFQHLSKKDVEEPFITEDIEPSTTYISSEAYIPSLDAESYTQKNEKKEKRTAQRRKTRHQALVTLRQFARSSDEPSAPDCAAIPVVDSVSFLKKEPASKPIVSRGESLGIPSLVIPKNQEIVVSPLGLLVNAIQANSYESVQKIVAKDPRLINQSLDDGMTPLMVALRKKNYDMVRLLLTHNAAIAAVTKEHVPTWYFATSDSMRWLLLSSAAQRGDLQGLDQMKRAGANLNKIYEGTLPLLVVASNNNKESTVRWMMRNGACANQPYHRINDRVIKHPTILNTTTARKKNGESLQKR